MHGVSGILVLLKHNKTVKPTFKGWLLYGWSFKHLFFRPDGEGKQEKKILLKNDTVTKAHLCPACGISVLHPGSKGPTTYFW